MKKSIMVKLDNNGELEVIVFNEKLVPLKNICAYCYVKVRNKSENYDNILQLALDLKLEVNDSTDKPLSDEELEFLFGPAIKYNIWVSKKLIEKTFHSTHGKKSFTLSAKDVKTPEEIAKKKVKKLSTGVESLDKLLENGIKFDELTPTMFGPFSGAEAAIGFGNTLNMILQGIKNVNGNQQNKSVKSGAEKLFEEVFKKPMYPTEEKVTPDLLEKKVNEIEMMSKIMNAKVKLSKEELFKEDGTRKSVEEVYQTVQDKLKDTVLKSDGKSTKEESDELKKAIQFMESPDPRFEAFKKVNEYFTKLGDAIKSDEVKDSKPMNLEEILEAIDKCESLEDLEKIITTNSVKIPKLKTGEARLDAVLSSGIPFTDIMEAIDANFFKNMGINNPKEKVTKEESVGLVDAEIDKMFMDMFGLKNPFDLLTISEDKVKETFDKLNSSVDGKSKILNVVKSVKSKLEDGTLSKDETWSKGMMKRTDDLLESLTGISMFEKMVDKVGTMKASDMSSILKPNLESRSCTTPRGIMMDNFSKTFADKYAEALGISKDLGISRTPLRVYGCLPSYLHNKYYIEDECILDINDSGRLTANRLKVFKVSEKEGELNYFHIKDKGNNIHKYLMLPREFLNRFKNLFISERAIDKILEYFNINFKTFKNEIFNLGALVNTKYYVEDKKEESIEEIKPPEENFGLDNFTLSLCKLFKTEPEKYAKFKETLWNIETPTKNIEVPNNTNLGTHTHPDVAADYTNVWTQSKKESPLIRKTIMGRPIKPCAQGYEDDNNTYLMKIDIGGIINLEALTNYDLEKCDNVKEDIYKFDMKFNSEAKKLVDFCKSFITKPGKNIFYFTIDFINAISKEEEAIDFKKIKFKKLNRKESKKLCVTFVDANYRVYGSSHEKPFTDLDGESKFPKSDYDDVFRLVKDKDNINTANMEMFIMGLFNKQTHPHWYLPSLVDETEFLYTKKFIDFLTKINPSYNMSNCNFELVYKYNK